MAAVPLPAERPTRARSAVVGFAIVVAIIAYADRVCISNAAPLLQKELGLDDADMKWAYWAFFFAYALLEIPGGWLGDRIGARKALTRVVVLWSIFTVATGRVRGFWSLILVRILFGAGEAGCFPNVTRAFSSWLPAKDRARAQGMVWFAARWGGALTPLLVTYLMRRIGWRSTFTLFGGVGVAWAVAFYFWYRDRPEDHSGVNAAERALLAGRERGAAHGPVPWGPFLRSRSVNLLWLQYMAINLWWPFYITYLPKYLQEARGLDVTTSALLGGLPLLLGGAGCVLAGLAASPLARRFGNLALVRKRLAIGGCIGAALCLVVSPHIASPTLAMIVLALASFSNDLLMPSAWATCMDIGGRYSGTLSGSMNMMGNLAASLFALAVGFVLQRSHGNWNVCFFGGAAFYIVAALAWKFIDPTERLDLGPEE